MLLFFGFLFISNNHFFIWQILLSNSQRFFRRKILQCHFQFESFPLFSFSCFQLKRWKLTGEEWWKTCVSIKKSKFSICSSIDISNRRTHFHQHTMNRVWPTWTQWHFHHFVNSRIKTLIIIEKWGKILSLI